MESIVAIAYLPSVLHAIVYTNNVKWKALYTQTMSNGRHCFHLHNAGSLHAYSIVYCLEHVCAVSGCMYVALENNKSIKETVNYQL